MLVTSPAAVGAWAEPEEHVEPVDASIINGGADVDPAHHGEDRAASTDEPDRGRDEFEFGVSVAALERCLPVLGVCRGQRVNVGL